MRLLIQQLFKHALQRLFYELQLVLEQPLSQLDSKLLVQQLFLHFLLQLLYLLLLVEREWLPNGLLHLLWPFKQLFLKQLGSQPALPPLLLQLALQPLLQPLSSRLLIFLPQPFSPFLFLLLKYQV